MLTCPSSLQAPWSPAHVSKQMLADTHLPGCQPPTQPSALLAGGGVAATKRAVPTRGRKGCAASSSMALAFLFLCPQPAGCLLCGDWDKAPTMGWRFIITCSLAPLPHPPWSDARLPCPFQHGASEAGLGWGQNRVVMLCPSNPVLHLTAPAVSLEHPLFWGMSYAARAPPSSERQSPSAGGLVAVPWYRRRLGEQGESRRKGWSSGLGWGRVSVQPGAALFHSLALHN